MRYAPPRVRNVDRVLPVAALFSLCVGDEAGDTVECFCDRGVVFEGEASAGEDDEELREVVVVLVDRSRRTVGACSESVYGLE